MYLYDSKTSQALEDEIIKNQKSGFLLMMRAASCILSHVKKKLTGRLWCIAGPGNNGGDAIATAALALVENIDVVCVRLADSTGDAAFALDFAKKLNLSLKTSLSELASLREGDVILDGIFGTGISRVPNGKMLKAIEWINKAHDSGISVIAVDVPSGLNATNGQTFGTAVRADLTVMCLTPKQGCYTGKSPELTGELYFCDLGIKNRSDIVCGNSKLILPENLTLPVRSRISHKGIYGNVLILGGWGEMEGAGFLAGIAALRVGAGKVYICGPSSKRQPFEIISVPKKIEIFKSMISKMNVVIAGPGLGEQSDKFLEIAWNADVPLVLDADGLNWLSRKTTLIRRKEIWIGTPHPGEAATLLGEQINDRFEALHKLSNKFGGIWVLKGAGTLVGPNPTFVNPFSNSILATAGSGDILSGIIGGLVSQKVIEPEILGVYLHSESARLVISSGKKTMIASDLLEKIGVALNHLKNE